jgi:hypothetical protein
MKHETETLTDLVGEAVAALGLLVLLFVAYGVLA